MTPVQDTCPRCGEAKKGTDWTCPHCGHTQWRDVAVMAGMALAFIGLGVLGTVMRVDGIDGLLMMVGGLVGCALAVMTAAELWKALKYRGRGRK